MHVSSLSGWIRNICCMSVYSINLARYFHIVCKFWSIANQRNKFNVLNPCNVIKCFEGNFCKICPVIYSCQVPFSNVSKLTNALTFLWPCWFAVFSPIESVCFKKFQRAKGTCKRRDESLSPNDQSTCCRKNPNGGFHNVGTHSYRFHTYNILFVKYHPCNYCLIY